MPSRTAPLWGYRGSGFDPALRGRERSEQTPPDGTGSGAPLVPVHWGREERCETELDLWRELVREKLADGQLIWLLLYKTFQHSLSEPSLPQTPYLLYQILSSVGL